MIDFFKAELLGPVIEKLINHPMLNFKGDFDVKTGEAHTETQIAEYQNLKFIIKNNKYINLQGSLHKYFTNGINYNDFTIEEIRSTLAKLTDEFGVDLRLSKLHNLEFGVNVELPYNPKRIIDSIINHKGESFEKMYGKARRTGKQSVKQQYTFKIYDKGAQCELNKFLLRVEIKVIKMKYLERYGIYTLSDLTNQDKLKHLMDDLIIAIKEVLMYDPGINLKKCSESERKMLDHGKYTEYWENLKKENKKMHDYRRNRFRDLNQKYGKNTQKQLAELIEEKAKFLLQTNSKCLAKLTEQAKSEFNQINHLSGMLNGQVKMTTSDDKTCAACGMVIKSRKNTAIYCSEECRIKAKNRRKNIRIPLLRLKNRYESNPVLFDTTQYLTLTKEQREISLMYGIYEIQ